MPKKPSTDETTRPIFSKGDELFDDSLQKELEEQKSKPVECLGRTFPNDAARREYYLARLKEHLEDPEFRKTPGFPKGTDEDILRMSDPPYYTACPNPFLGDFIKAHGKPYDPNDKYHRDPLSVDVSEGKQDPVCMAHTYHTKVPYRAIVRYILNYTDPGDIILDCFAGSGMTAVAAQACASPSQDLKEAVERDLAARSTKWGVRRAVLSDLSPFATHLCRNFTSTLSSKAFEREFARVIDDVEKSLGWVYEAKTTRDGTDGTIDYVLWADVVTCECGQACALWDPALLGSTESYTTTLKCAVCDRPITKSSDTRVVESRWDEATQSVRKQFKQVPVLVQFDGPGGSGWRRPTPEDLALIDKTEKMPKPSSAPMIPMMFDGTDWGEMFRAGIHYGITHSHHFWTGRNLAVLDALFNRARRSEHASEMLFGCTSFAVKTGTRMHSVGFKGGRINLAGQTYNTLQMPSVSAERNLFILARGKARDLRAVFALRKAADSVLVTTQSSTHLQQLPDNSIDYVFVDPPFGDNIMYSELSFLYEAWLRVFTNQCDEAIVSGHQAKGVQEYQKLICAAFREMRRVLKPGRWMTVVFHNSKNVVWNAIQEALGMAGFVVADVRILDKGQGTYKQMTTAGAVKQDLVISAYRPNGGFEQRFTLSAGTAEGVWDFVRTHLRQLPVCVVKGERIEMLTERQAFLLFDRMVAFHVQRGVSIPLSAGSFYEGLAERFAERDGMYFLAEQVGEYDRKRTGAKELEQLELFVTNESSAIQWLRRELREKPQSFQDLQPQFMQETRGWAKHETPLDLRVLLNQNFLLYDGHGELPSQIHAYLSTNFKDLRGRPKDDALLRAKAKDRWYVPDPKKSGDLEKLRERELLKEFEGYKATKSKQLKVFRVEAMRAGFKAAYDKKDYATIVELAERLPETVLQEDEKLLMYYDVASMRLGDRKDKTELF